MPDQSFRTLFREPLKLPKICLRRKNTPRGAEWCIQAMTESFFPEQVAELSVQHQGCRRENQPKTERRGQKRPSDLMDEEPQEKRAKVQRTALDITQNRGAWKAVEREGNKNVPLSSQGDMKMPDQSFRTLFREPLPKICLRRKNTQRGAEWSIQAMTESFFPEQVAELRVQHQGCKVDNQPKTERRGQKRPSDLMDEERQQKRAKVQRTALDIPQNCGDWMGHAREDISTLFGVPFQKTCHRLKFTPRRAKRGSQAMIESFSLEVAEPRVQHQEADQPRPERRGQKRSLDRTDEEPQPKRLKVQGTALDITPHSEELKADERDLGTLFGVPIQETRRRLKITPKRGKRGSQVMNESLAPEVAEPIVQHREGSEKDQPQPERRGQKRPSNLKDEDKPQVKRPSVQRHEKKAGHHASTQPAYLMAYEKGKLLGKGGFGSVFAGIRKADGLPVAIKYVSKQKDDIELECEELGLLPIEIALMSVVNKEPSCSNILQMLDWYDEPDCYIMILERPEPCEDLHKFCSRYGGSLPESVARYMIVQLIEALKHCKSCGVVHRDVKPENVLVETYTQHVKLFDFGCGDLARDIHTDFAGTRVYYPPEWFKKKCFWPEPGTVWSVGVTLYRLVCGYLPFRGTSEIKKGHLDFPKYLSQGKELQRLISFME